MRVAAIDIGTNTTRLLAAEAVGAGYRDLARRLVFTRLGQGVDAGGRISREALRRTLAAIAEFCALCGELRVERLRVAGTSALRDAANREDFAKAAARVTGVGLEVLTGMQEAELSFSGATRELPSGPYVVCDIGGGSTEFVLGTTGGSGNATLVSGRVSLNIGSVRLTERHLASDPPATEEILIMEGRIDGALGAVDSEIPGLGAARLVGVAGTVTSLAAIHLGLETYDSARTHHQSLTVEQVNAAYRRLAAMSLSDRRTVPVLPPRRADIIVAGASILTRSMARWSFPDVLVSEKDILDGLVLAMLNDQGDPGSHRACTCET